MPVSPETQHPPRGFSLTKLRDRIAEVLSNRGSIPCVADPEGGWTSSDRALRERAADRCLDCEALSACVQYVESNPQPDGVWGGRLQPPRPRTTYVKNIPHVSMGTKTEQHLTRAFTEPKERIMTKTTTPATGTCLCGCSEPATRNYRPGHDARHVSQLVREVAAGLDKRAALKALPTEPLRAKFTRALGKATAVAA